MNIAAAARVARTIATGVRELPTILIAVRNDASKANTRAIPVSRCSGLLTFPIMIPPPVEPFSVLLSTPAGREERVGDGSSSRARPVWSHRHLSNIAFAVPNGRWLENGENHDFLKK